LKKKAKGSYHHGDLPRCLIEAGKQELAEKGIHGLSLREVAKAAGVSHTAIYRHFNDKADLLAAISQNGFEELTAAAVKAAGQCGQDLQKQFIAAAVQYVLFAIRHPQTAQLMFGGVIEMKNAPKPLKQASHAAFDLMTGIIEKGKSAGLLKPLATLDMAVATWAGIHGLAMLIVDGYLTRLAGTEKKIEQLSEMVCRVLLDGMMKADS
jgi:AcrR family transcriptional regulator